MGGAECPESRRDAGEFSPGLRPGNVAKQNAPSPYNLFRIRTSKKPGGYPPPRNFLIPFRRRRTPRKLAKRRVSNILQIFNPDFAGVKPVASHLPQKSKESHALAERRVLFRVLAKRNQVHHFFALLRRAFKKRSLVIAVRA